MCEKCMECLQRTNSQSTWSKTGDEVYSGLTNFISYIYIYIDQWNSLYMDEPTWNFNGITNVVGLPDPYSIHWGWDKWLPSCRQHFHFGEFLGLLLGYSLSPKTILPMHIGGNRNCIFIDNIFCTITNKNRSLPSGKLHIKSMDHFPYFLSLNWHNNSGIIMKNVKVRVNSKQVYESWLCDLWNADVLSSQTIHKANFK